MQRTINNMTLYELMSEDFDVFIKMKKDNSFDILMDGETIFLEESNVHCYAMDSMASFCRQFLDKYDRAKKRDFLCLKN